MIESFMLNPFPALLSMSILAPFLLRIAIGYLLVSTGVKHIQNRKTEHVQISRALSSQQALAFIWIISIIEIAIGALLIVGLFTQIAALLLVVVSVIGFKNNNHVALRSMFPHTAQMYFLIAIIGVTLMLSGAGIFSLDLPF